MDISDEHGGARGTIIGCGELSRNGQVSGNGGMGGSSWVIGGMSSGDWASGQMIGHNEWIQRDAGRSGQTEGQSRGAKPSPCNVLLVLTVNFSSILLYCAETMGN